MLWERDWINVEEIDKYGVDGKDEYKDENGQVKKEYQRYVLRTLMKKYRDFKEEKSAIEALLLSLTSKSDSPSVQLLTSSKYHCELAVEGVEYVWGVSKQHYRSLPLNEKNTNVKFEKSMRRNMRHVITKNMYLFGSRCQRYMMGYNAYHKSNGQLTFLHLPQPRM